MRTIVGLLLLAGFWIAEDLFWFLASLLPIAICLAIGALILSFF